MGNKPAPQPLGDRQPFGIINEEDRLVAIADVSIY